MVVCVRSLRFVAKWKRHSVDNGCADGGDNQETTVRILTRMDILLHSPGAYPHLSLSCIQTLRHGCLQSAVGNLEKLAEPLKDIFLIVSKSGDYRHVR